MTGTPLGDVPIVIAEDTETGDVVGQLIVAMSRVWVDGREVLALRPHAPIVLRAYRPSIRGMNLIERPTVAMVRFGLAALRDRGASLLYTVSAPHMVRLIRIVLRLVPDIVPATGGFPLWSLPLALQRPPVLEAGYTVRPLSPLDGRIDRLWYTGVHLHGCQVVRRSAELAAKLARDPCGVLGVERDGDLVGLVASRQRGNHQWLVCDLVVADARASLRNTVLAACVLAQDSMNQYHPPLRKVGILATPVMEPELHRLGFRRESYTFAVGVGALDGSIDPRRVTPERWYLSAND